MSKPDQWTTTYSSVFRDRRKYAAPDARPSDDSWSVRTQGYYGTRAALGEHGARTAEVEARTDYGARPVNDFNGSRSGSFNGSQSARAGGFNGSISAPYTGASGSASSAGAFNASVRYTHPQKDLWTHSILPHTTAVIRDNVPIFPGLNDGRSTQRTYFHNGYNNGYSSELQFDVEEHSQNQLKTQAPHVPQQHIPGYQGVVRGSQFVHGQTFGKTTRDLLAVPTEVPLEP